MARHRRRRPAEGDGPGRLAPSDRAQGLRPRQPEHAGTGGPSPVSLGPLRDQPRTVRRGQRPARAGPGDRRPEESADGAGAGQSRLDAPLRRRRWSTRPATSARGATRRRNPELLDHLATAFMDDGWSIKALHRRIVLSAAYRQSSDDRPDGRRSRSREPSALADEPPPARLRVDPRLPAGRLRPARPERRRAFGEAGARRTARRRRTLYGSIDRLNLPGLYRTFDFPDPSTTAPQRDETTVPPQALFFMNHPLARESAAGLMARADVAARADHRRTARPLLRDSLRPDARRPRERAALREFLGSRPADADWQRSARPSCSATSSLSSTDGPIHVSRSSADHRSVTRAARPAPPRRHGLRPARPGRPLVRGDRPRGQRRATKNPPDAEGRPLPRQGEAGRPPVHERRADRRSTRSTRSRCSTKYHGKPTPSPNLRTERKTGAAMRSPFSFKKYGQSGLEVSELFAKTAAFADDLCVIRSMHADVPNHEPSLMLMNCGDGRLLAAQRRVVGHVRARLREPEPAGLHRHVPRRLPDRRDAELAVGVPAGRLPGHVHRHGADRRPTS